ncbi:glycosyltransferase [Microbacterium sp. QXD-8]|uniref:Glycosyltransferase n=1 Tax=Microbacterium psychrotolerans TaxID=3068321 RepID=A0ABU0Z4M1_9MICO|nr:glycosyltransferase [Microbacterium sp. QXD-8]MDQ7879532.1 glycosyltransferase [Microbacterium sp. QXD-8]
MVRPTRVLSLYEGFFAGGARILHSDVVAGLHAGGDQHHSVLAIASRTHRESTVQRMEDDPRYHRLVRAGVRVTTLGKLVDGDPAAPDSFTDQQLQIAAEAVNSADLILSLKEQPLGILLALRSRGMMPAVPVAACLHRSDPLHSGAALGWLTDAAATGLLTATISCAEATDRAYARAGVAAENRYVIANGVDTDRFRPASRTDRQTTRRGLGITPNAAVIAYAARFDAMKDPGLFLRALALHARQHRGAHYVLCGAGMSWENPAFRALAAECGVEAIAQIHALGIRQDMPSIYQVADIVALTSAFGEASPLCLIEGAACGATPVTTDVGDAAAQVDGIGVVTPRCPETIAQTWQFVLQNRAAFRRRALAARPRLGRQRMLNDYRAATHDMLRREEVAA